MKFSAVDRRGEGGTLLRQCQLTELYLFDVFVEICEANNLRYFITAGTLLGALRHKGFIPWDDDIDVVMPLEDYKRFVKIAPGVLPETILMQTPANTPGAAHNFIKLRDRCSLMCEPRTNVQLPSGIFLDIFPFIRYPNLPSWLVQKLNLASCVAWYSAMHHRTMPHRDVFGLFASGVKASVWTAISVLIDAFLRVSAMMLPGKYNNSPGSTTYRCEGLGADEIFPLRKAKFEGRDCNIPLAAEKFLEQCYGDWRKLPPEKDRVWHADIICPTKAPRVWWAMPYEGGTT